MVLEPILYVAENKALTRSLRQSCLKQRTYKSIGAALLLHPAALARSRKHQSHVPMIREQSRAHKFSGIVRCWPSPVRGGII